MSMIRWPWMSKKRHERELKLVEDARRDQAAIDVANMAEHYHKELSEVQKMMSMRLAEHGVLLFVDFNSSPYAPKKRIEFRVMIDPEMVFSCGPYAAGREILDKIQANLMMEVESGIRALASGQSLFNVQDA